MDRSAHDNLFSRGPSTPDLVPLVHGDIGPVPASAPGPVQTQPPPPQQLHQRPSPTLSYREPPTSGSPSHLDALFQNLSQSATQYGGAHPPPQHPHPNGSGPATPMSVASHSSAQSQTTADRQSALLSLLGSVGPAPAAAGPPPPQQIPTPPGSSQSRAPPGSTSEQGRVLLEQLMGNVSPQSQSQSQPQLQQHQQQHHSPPQPFFSPRGPGPEPEYPPAPYEAINSPHAQAHALPPMGPLLPPPPPPQQQQQQAPMQMHAFPGPGALLSPHELPPPAPQPSPPKSMFDFVSPFDALAAPPAGGNGSGNGKKAPGQGSKPLPVPGAQPQGHHPSQGQEPQPFPTQGAGEEPRPLASWAADPKRKSVENLMEQLTRGQAQAPPSSSSPQFDPYYGAEELTPIAQQPLASPRGSPTRIQQQQQQQQQSQGRGRSIESPLGHAQGAVSQGHRRERSSPVPAPGARGAFVGGAGGKGARGKQAQQQQPGRSYGSPT
jgi:hypothetical protein